MERPDGGTRRGRALPFTFRTAPPSPNPACPATPTARSPKTVNRTTTTYPCGHARPLLGCRSLNSQPSPLSLARAGQCPDLTAIRGKVVQLITRHSSLVTFLSGRRASRARPRPSTRTRHPDTAPASALPPYSPSAFQPFGPSALQSFSPCPIPFAAQNAAISSASGASNTRSMPAPRRSIAAQCSACRGSSNCTASPGVHPWSMNSR